MSGYTDCACGTCFEIAISGDEPVGETFCLECEEAGCEVGAECQRTDLDDEDEWHGAMERKESYSDNRDD